MSGTFVPFLGEDVNGDDIDSGGLVVPVTLVAGTPTPGVLPYVTTGAATGVYGMGATLNGTVFSNDPSTQWYFESGTDTRYGNATPLQLLGAENVSASIGGLKGHTTFHFRLDAVKQHRHDAGRGRHIYDAGQSARCVQ